MVETHVKAHFAEVDHAVRNGVSLTVDGETTLWNVVVFLVADLCMLKEIIGQCQSTSTYGCYHCKLPKNDWTKSQPGANNWKPLTAEPKNVADLLQAGITALKELGNNPDHQSAEFKAVQLRLYG